MCHPVAARVRLIAWLICVLVGCLAMHSPYCTLCDGFHLTKLVAAAHPTADHPASALDDACNGACNCCEFRCVPQVCVPIATIAALRAAFVHDTPLPLFAPRITILRPPRTVFPV